MDESLHQPTDEEVELAQTHEGKYIGSDHDIYVLGKTEDCWD